MGRKLIKYRNLIIVVLLFVAGMLISCVRNDYALKDGYYTAEESEYDSAGWKDYLTVCISGGQIIVVEYNAYNPAGFLKSWDMDYMREMKSEDDTYPNTYSRFYGRQLLELQDAEGIDVLSGATRSYLAFTALSKAVLQSARAGNRSTTLVPPKEPF